MKSQIIILFFFICLTLYAREYSIKINTVGNLKGYTLYINELDLILETDDKGYAYTPIGDKINKFEFKEGSYNIDIIFQSKKDLKIIEINENTSDIITLNVNFSQSSGQAKKLKEINIQDTGPKVSKSRNVLTIDEAKFIPGTGGDPLRSIVNFPGVVATSAFSSVLFIRGGDPGDVLYTYGLVPVNQPFHNIGFYSVFSDYVIDSINFYPAAYPVYFNNSQGAVIEIVPRSLNNTQKLKFDIDINPAVAKGNFSFALKDNMQLTLGGKRSYYEFYISLVNKVTNLPFNLKPFYYDANLKYDWRINNENSLSVTGIIYNDIVKFNYNNFPLTNSQGQTNYFSISADLDLYYDLESVEHTFKSDKVKNEISAYRYYERQQISVFKLDFKIEKKDYGITDLCRFNFSDIYALSFGSKVIYQIQPYTIKEYEDDSFFTNDNLSAYEVFKALTTNRILTLHKTAVRYLPSVFFNNEMTLNKFTFNLGLNSELNTINNKYTLDPRSSINYEIKKDADVYLRAGKYSQGKSIFPFMIEKQGNPDLNYQYSWHYVAGSEFLLLKDYLLKTEIYYKHLYDQVMANPYYERYTSKEYLEKNPAYVNTGEGEAYGYEVMMRRRITKGIFGWLSYSYSHSMRTIYKTNASTNFYEESQRHNKDMYWLLSDYDVPNALNLVTSFEIIPEELKLGVKYSLQSGQPYTPADRVIETYNPFTKKTNKTLIFSDNLNSARMPFTHQLSLRADFTFDLSKKISMSLYLDCWNVQWLFKKWQRNVISYYYNLDKINPGDDPEKKKTPIYDLPIMPFLGLKIIF